MIFAPPTVNVNGLPSFTVLVAGVTEYVVLGVVLVSLIVIVLDVATTVPLTLPVLILAVNVSAPSVEVSAVGVTVNDPILLVIVKLPVDVPKSPLLVIVQ